MKSNEVLVDFLGIKAYIDSLERAEDESIRDAGIPRVAEMLDNFWRDYCESTRTILWLVTYTVHDHAAKGMWADLDYDLRHLIKRSKYL